MKTEPLKNKKKYFLDGDCFFKEDVKSAVEWLKEVLEEYTFGDNNQSMSVLDLDHIKNLINESFEDVIE